MFSERLRSALEQHPACPPQLHGRQTWLRDHLEEDERIVVSLNTINKWLKGKSEPRREKVRVLSEVLRVDEAWLWTGRVAGADRVPTNAPAMSTHSAKLALAGLIGMSGGAVSFPKDNTSDVAPPPDFSVSLQGRTVGVIAALGERKDDATVFRWNGSNSCTPIGATVQDNGNICAVEFWCLRNAPTRRDEEGHSYVRASHTPKDATRSALLTPDGFELQKFERLDQLL